jgi:hypothetical protein
MTYGPGDLNQFLSYIDTVFNKQSVNRFQLLKNMTHQLLSHEIRS